MDVNSIIDNRNGKGKTWLGVADGAGWWNSAIPLMWVAGKKTGPVLTVSGAVHGDEYEGGAAIRQLWQEIDPEKLQGTFLGVPAVNMPAHRVGSRTSPLDHADMNRVFPGKTPGNISEMTAFTFHEQLTKRSDCLIDLHAGGSCYSMLPLGVFLLEGSDRLQQREWELIKATGLTHLWWGGGKWSATHVAAIRSGVMGMLLELGQEGGCCPDRVSLAVQCVSNVMKHLGMIDGRPPAVDPVCVRGTYMTATSGGLIMPECKAGDMVRKGQLLGTIIDVFGGELEQIQATYDGLVCSVRTRPSIEPGQWTVFVGKLVDKPVVG